MTLRTRSVDTVFSVIGAVVWLYEQIRKLTRKRKGPDLDDTEPLPLRPKVRDLLERQNRHEIPPPRRPR